MADKVTEQMTPLQKFMAINGLKPGQEGEAACMMGRGKDHETEGTLARMGKRKARREAAKQGLRN
jgi:hypothetical protein